VRYLDHISRDPQICGGVPVIRGTRVTLRTLLASLAEGCEKEEIHRNFPAVTKEDLKAVIAFAAASCSRLRRFVPGTHAGFVLVRLKQEGLRAVITKFRAIFEEEDVESWRGCFVVISETKIRIRRP